MFTSNTSIVATIDASIKSFGHVIAEHIGKGFTGRITYRDISKGVFISVEMVKGVLTACRASERGAVFEGADCEHVAANYLYLSEGVIEVAEVRDSDIFLDVILFPHSMISEAGTLATIIQRDLRVAPRPAAPSPKPVTPPPTPPPSPQVPQPKPVTAPVAQQPPPTPQPQAPLPPPPVKPEAKAEKAAEFSVSNECIDPLAVYTLLKSGKMHTVFPEISYNEAVKKMQSIAKEAKVKNVYLSANIQEGTARIVIDVEKRATYIEFEDQKGNVVCGEGAEKKIRDGRLLNAKIWVLE